LNNKCGNLETNLQHTSSMSVSHSLQSVSFASEQLKQSHLNKIQDMKNLVQNSCLISST